MKTYVVAVFDSAMQAFGQPFFVPTINMALRSFGDEVNRAAPDNHLNRHPDDYELFQLATFEQETGIFENSQRSLARAKDLVNT